MCHRTWSKHSQPFDWGGGFETGVGGGEAEPGQPAFDERQGRGELERVGGTQRMGAHQATREPVEFGRGRDFQPISGQSVKQLMRLFDLSGKDALFAETALQGRFAFDRGSPPDGD